VNWDYIVIGAGSAGCALAYELANSGQNATVLVVEAGGSDRSPFIRFPAGQIRAIGRHDWGYRSQPDSSRNGTTERWFRGRVLGGSSSINGTMYVRGSAEDFNRWAAQCGQAAGWSANEVMPIYRELESSDQPGPHRGRTGPLHVRTVRRPHAMTEAFIAATCACGYPFNEDYNGEVQEGVAYAQLSQRNGLRCSAADAFLKPLLGKKNIKLLLNATAHKITFSNSRAVGIAFLHNRKMRSETAREIVVCAGAIDSPKLLMMSGVGDSEELRRHNIDVVVDLPGVGRNLKEHPLLKLTYRTTIPTYNFTEGLLQKLGVAAEFLKHREGPISNLFEGAAFLKSSLSEPGPDIQLHFLPIGYLTTSDGTIEFAPYPSVTVILNKSYPKSSGRIRLAGNDPDDPPLIECRLLDDESDVETLVQGVEAIRRIMKTEPIAHLIDAEMAPGPDMESIPALRDYVRSHTEIAFHPAGTCRMGTGGDAVVGPNLRVHGTDHLWVADASIMPDLISGNTNAACMMIGAKLGRQLATAR